MNKKFKKKEKLKSFEFWDQSKKKISPALLSKFLNLNNFYVFDYYNKEIIVKINNSVAETYSPKKVFVFCLNFIKKKEKKKKEIDLENLFIKEGETLLMTRKGVLAGLERLSKKLYRDSKTRGIIFYKNCFITVTNGKIKKHLYSKLTEIIPTQFIFESQIINRDFSNNIKEIKSLAMKSQSYQLAKLATNNESHLLSLNTCKGYALHKYKDPSGVTTFDWTSR